MEQMYSTHMYERMNEYDYHVLDPLKDIVLCFLCVCLCVCACVHVLLLHLFALLVMQLNTVFTFVHVSLIALSEILVLFVPIFMRS